MQNNYTDGITLDSANKNIQMFSGGSTKGEESSPFTKGFFFVFFTLPPKIFNTSMDPNIAAQVLRNLCKNFQPPADRQLNFVEDKSIGNNTSKYLVGHTTTNEFTLTLKEKAKSPACRVVAKWAGYIDPLLGASVVADTFGPDEYKGACIVIQTKPVARLNKTDWKKSDIIKVHQFEGVVPNIDPMSMFGNDIETNTEKVEIPVPFSFDGSPLTELVPEVLDNALELLRNQDLIYKQTMDFYSQIAEKDFTNGSNI